MNAYNNARLTPSGLALMAERIDQGGSAQAAAQAAGVSTMTAHKWRRRHRLGPKAVPRHAPELQVAEMERLRRQRMTGPRIA
ncbi:MAG: leucine zipper domain-containing protein [Phenylobacterium sp.]|jgi:transposase-like protein|uniref:leucine zipper domain-containing protein n=1 Tax=Phenylobacterium sp. TaxID=1871053 RepID=UPI00391F7DB7